MNIHHTIWFRPHNTSGALSVVVERRSDNHAELDSLARVVWDNLAKVFEMVSTRP